MQQNSHPLKFVHRWIPTNLEAKTLLLLHGTGGDENDLLPLGRTLDPEANLLSLRGQVIENGMPRFFRRLSEGVFDVPDLIQRTEELKEFIEAAAVEYRFNVENVTVAGFSNGANIAGSLLLLHPDTLTSAVLLHPMVPLVPNTLPDLSKTRVFIGAGRQDTLVSNGETERLAALLRQFGANVTLFWSDGGHVLSREEVQAAVLWLR